VDAPGAGLGFLEPIIVFGVMGFVLALRLAQKKASASTFAST
jgi:hypothetical protein